MIRKTLEFVQEEYQLTYGWLFYGLINDQIVKSEKNFEHKCIYINIVAGRANSEKLISITGIYMYESLTL